MIEQCIEDYAGGGYHFNLSDAVGGAGMPVVVPGPDYSTLGFSELKGGGGKKKKRKSRKLKKSNKSRLVSRSKKSKSRSNKKVYKRKSLSKKMFRKKSKKSRKSLK
tara:strand:+ start:1489 stop:1806 length:318 start_codon:yes stop_codon:yes gene_type:complete